MYQPQHFIFMHWEAPIIFMSSGSFSDSNGIKIARIYEKMSSCQALSADGIEGKISNYSTHLSLAKEESSRFVYVCV